MKLPDKTSILIALLLCLGACSAPRLRSARVSFEEVLLDRQARHYRELRRQQREISWANPGPRIEHFPGYGSIMIDKWYLEGFPGEEYVRVRFTYENSTDQEFRRVRVWVNVHDDEGMAVSSEWLDLILLFGWPGNTYTDEIRVPTRGIHMKPGWHWRIGCMAS